MTNGQPAQDELGNVTQASDSLVPASWLVVLWLAGLACAVLWWGAFEDRFTEGELGTFLLFFVVGVLSIPLLITAAILTALEWRSRQTNRQT